MMKRLRKTIQWLLLLSLFVSNMPLIYAEEINQAIKQGQAEEAYKKAVTEASSQTVGSENANTEASRTAVLGLGDIGADASKPVKDGGDALQQPKVVNGESKAEAELKKQYGAPVAVSGQEQLFRVDDTHFVTHIGSDIKTYIDKEGVEVPVDLSLYSYHANGKHYYLPKESPVGVVLPSEVKEDTPIDITHKDDKISLYPLDKTYEQATVEKNAILYNNVDGKTDVQVFQ